MAALLIFWAVIFCFFSLDLIMAKSEPVKPDASPSADQIDVPGFGWTPYAERLNGRFAMVGVLALLLLEFFTRQDFFTWLGWP